MASVEPGVRLVVVGAAAGAGDSLRRLLAGGLAVPVIVAQHGGAAASVQTLQPREPLRSGGIYAVPPGQGVEFSDGMAHFVADPGAGPTPSIEHLFRSAAMAFGEAVAAVLVGDTGLDGAEGALAVGRHGGTVVAESVPDRAPPMGADLVVDPDRLLSLLQSLLSGADITADSQLTTFLERVRLHTGLDFGLYKRPTIERRLRRRMTATDSATLLAYEGYLDIHPEEYQRLAASFLIKVTDFFRDTDLFAHLRDRVLPELIARTAGTGREIRVWSAGCATGEEPYSVAILLCEALGAAIDNYQVRIFATDVDSEAVAYARRGRYPAAALAGVDPALVSRYFRTEDGRLAITDRVRNLVLFSQHDLGQRPPFPRIDLVLCRNVLIYFTPEMQSHALKLFAFSLRPDGVLVLGKAETAGSAADLFRPENEALKIYRRQDGAVVVPPARVRIASASLSAGGPPGRGHGAAAAASGTAAIRIPARRTPISELSEVSFSVPVGVAVVNADYDIVYINAAGHDLLGIRAPSTGGDLVHRTRTVPGKLLRRLIDGTLRTGSDTRANGVALDEPAGHHPRVVDLLCRRVAGLDGSSLLAMLVLSDVTQHAERAAQLEREAAEAKETANTATMRLERVEEANRELREADEELTAENFRLRAANETMALGHEEIQAASEEVETLNEELQASNEELETLNEELQAAVEELNAANEDLQARAVEMQELAAAREAQRLAGEAARERLEVVLASIASAVVVVDADGAPLMANQNYEQLMRDSAGAQLLDGEGRPRPPGDRPELRAAQGETFRAEYRFVDRNGQHRWLEAIGNPLRDGPFPGRAGPAGVVAIRDITDRTLRRLQDEFLATSSHELRTPLTAMNLYMGMLNRQYRALGAHEPLRPLLEGLSAEMHRFSLLVNDLTDSVRVQSGRLTLRREIFDLGPLVHRVGAVAREMAGGREVHVEVPQESVWVNGDPNRIEQVLMNLLDNAIRHAPGSAPIDLRVMAQGPWAILEVEDRGPGIPASELPNLFTRFYRPPSGDGRRESGLGLGLYIVRELAIAHGGQVDVRSVKGEGTVFTVQLPAAP